MQLVLLDHKDLPDLPVQLGLLDHKVQLELLVHLVLEVEVLVLLVLLVQQAQLVHKDQKEIRGLQVHQIYILEPLLFQILLMEQLVHQQFLVNLEIFLPERLMQLTCLYTPLILMSHHIL